ncbi:MAG: FeoB-associated Cys-rich membrane protein [Erysipelotrichaceae bacterium]|nr:FeoB-associated Cys-rich membrane protein [Erysipelotrichaceae bacterium]
MNLASFLTALTVLLIVAVMIRSLIKEKKEGKCSCGCSSCNGVCSHRFEQEDRGDKK